jgi:transglutaminase-like putative cysteine protease
MVLPSEFARPTDLLVEFAESLGIGRHLDPLSAVRALSEGVFRAFEYRPQSTRVDSPIDDALTSRQGVCQDFAHVMTALVRRLGMPCRYVSGYLFHAKGERSAEGATHAWVEALLPGNGWVGFDPTSNAIAGPRHVRVAVGRDYADVAPTRGVYKGVASGTLAVAVHVSRDDLPPVSMRYSPALTWTAAPPAPPRIQGGEDQQ